MKIAYFSDTFLPSINGVVTSICNSSRLLAARGHEVTIFACTPRGAMPEKFRDDVRVVYFPRVGAAFYPGFDLARPLLFRLFLALCKSRPDVVHIHTPGPLGWSAITSAKILRIPIISTYHTMLPDFMGHVPIPNLEKSRIAKRAAWTYTRRFHRRCDATIAPSESMQTELEGQRLPNVVTISNGVDINDFGPSPEKQAEKKFRALHVGRLSYEKNIDNVIRAFKLFSEKHDAVLQIVGAGPEAENLKALAAELNANVEFSGKVSHEELISAYNSADVFVTASTVETEGIVVLEAMACGLPVVGVQARALTSLVENGKNGFISEPDNIPALANCLAMVYEKGKPAFSEAARRTAIEHSLDKSIDKIEILYKQLAAQKPKGFFEAWF